MSDEVKLDVIEKTQKILGKHIVKPPLTEKLLKKPPFRFLHDIVTSVIRDTGFLKGLFSDTELISDNVKERDAKIAFLTKFIEAMKTITEIQLKVKPTKIIAGLEPLETNKLLQALGTALDKKLDSSEYVKKNNSKYKSVEKVKKPSKTIIKDEKDKESARAKKHQVEATKPKKKESSSRENNSNEVRSQEKIKKKSKKDAETRKVENNKISPKFEERVPIQTNLKNIENDQKNKEKENAVAEPILQQKLEEKITRQIDNTMAETAKQSKPVEDNVQKKIRSDRPKSARPQSADLKKLVSNEVDKIEEADVAVQKLTTTARPMSTLRPPSVRPSSARPGAPRLKPDSALPLHEMIPLGKINVIVENYNTKEIDEEETVIIQNVEIEPEPVQQILNMPEDKGHLVEQILEQIHDDDVVEHVKSKNDIDWEGEGFRNRDATNKEVNQLRSQIQSLTKVANPFGKLMNYLHEDVESMLSELNMWMNMKRDMYTEINKQKKINEESSKPLKLQLADLKENIKKQQAEIVNIQANILRNELRIKDLLIQ